MSDIETSLTGRRRGLDRERWISIAAIVVVVAVAAVVLVLLQSARRDGIQALEAATESQVVATASSFDSRVVSAIQSVAPLGAGWELAEGSAADLARMSAILIDPEALSGAFLVDASQTITQGVLLTNAGVGDRYDQPDWDAHLSQLATAPAVVSDVGPGVTTDLPAYAFLIGIRSLDPAEGVIGAFVFEVAVHAESSFNQEIGRLAGPDSAASWYFVDGSGVVIASTEPAALGSPIPVPLERLGEETVARDSGNLYMVAPVPSVGWEVVFAESTGAFESALSDPLQFAGIVLISLLLVVGVTFVVILQRRLAASRDEERRIRRLASSQEEFISIVSHELRTPVAGVLGFLQSSVDHWDRMSDDERLHAVRRAVGNARRLQSLTRDVLDAESLEAGRLAFDLESVDLVAEIGAAKEALALLEQDRPVEIIAPAGPITVLGDADRLQQVLTNLVDNARNHTPAGTPIELTLSSTSDLAVIEVTDHGAGVDPETIEHLFEKFVRGRGDSVSGTGLGLYICHQIIQAHHGTIDVTSGPAGTTFRVELPRTGDDPDSRDR